MWVKVEKKSAAPPAGKGVEAAVRHYGKAKFPVVMVKIWRDVLEDLVAEADSDANLLLGTEDHAGKLKIELDRAGTHTLKAPRGTDRFLQLQATLEGYEEKRERRPVPYEVIDDGMGLIVDLGALRGSEPDSPAGQVERLKTAPSLRVVKPAEPEAPTQEAPAPEPAKPAPQIEEGGAWLSRAKDAAQHAPRVCKVLDLLAGEGSVSANVVIYAFRPAIKESVAKMLLADAGRAIEAAGRSLNCSDKGIYSVGPADA